MSSLRHTWGWFTDYCNNETNAAQCRCVLRSIVNSSEEKVTEQCCGCRRFFSEHESAEQIATLLEDRHPQCCCEKLSVGQNSPGPVEDHELLHRIIISPRDCDDGRISVRPFEKAFTNGLSVWRAFGPNEDVRSLMMEGLSRRAGSPERAVIAVCEARTSDVRDMTSDSGERLFCVYDQTVSRALDPSLPPVPTHAGVFLRTPPPGTADRKRIQKDYIRRLYKEFISKTIDANEYRSGLCVDLNQRAKSGEFG